MAYNVPCVYNDVHLPGIRNSILLYFFKYYLDKTSMISMLEVFNKGLFGLIDKLGMLDPMLTLPVMHSV